MAEMIDLIKAQILGYAAEKRTIEGLSEITENVTLGLASTLNTSPERVHKAATRMVRQALCELKQEYS